MGKFIFCGAYHFEVSLPSFNDLIHIFVNSLFKQRKNYCHLVNFDFLKMALRVKLSFYGITCCPLVLFIISEMSLCAIFIEITSAAIYV